MRCVARGAVMVLALSLASSCLNPTEIVLELGTDVACGVVAANGVAVAIGAPGDDETLLTTATFMCSPDGGIGSLVVTPSGSIDEEVGIRVTLGIDASAQSCMAPSFSGCVVARRALRFDPHTPLTLPIDLDQSCVGVPCTPDSTCVDGTCVDASVGPCSGVCNVSDGGAPPDVAADAPATTQSVVMFGGSTDCSGSGNPPVLDETWSWDGATWASMGSGPSEYLFAMSTLGNDTVVFGGVDSTRAYVNQTWIWDGASWSTKTQTGPSARAFAAMAVSSKRAVLFGGCDDCYVTSLGDTWTWDGSAWASDNAIGPSARQAHAMATLGSNVVLFGGTPYAGSPTDSTETWVYDGTSWSQKVVAGPSARDGHVMASLGSTVVLFGGEFPTGGAYQAIGETWIWNGSSWTQFTGTPQPSPRFYGAMATLGNTVVLFGGVNASGTPIGDTWTFDGSTWTQQQVSGGPGARCGHGMASR